MAKFSAEQIDEWIAEYAARRALVQERIDDIEKDGWRHYEGVGNEPMTDITDEWLQDMKAEVAMWTRHIQRYEEMKAEP